MSLIIQQATETKIVKVLALNYGLCREKWLKAVLLGRKLQLSRFHHSEAPKMLLLS